MRQCSCCGEIKPLSEFQKRTDIKGVSYRYKCKACKKIEMRARYIANAEAAKAWQREWNKNNKDTKKESSKRWALNNPQKVKESRARWIAANPEKERERQRRWRLDNPDRAAARAKKWCENNPERRREVQTAANRKRYQNPTYRISAAISSGIRRTLRGSKAHRSWRGLVGYSIDELRVHLEAQFEPWMTWDNYGSEWEIDHIIPIAHFSFTSTNCEDFLRAWALANLQPLEKSANRRKSAKLVMNG